MIPVLGVPIYNRVDLLIRCLESIDYPVGRVVIVNNGQLLNLGEDLFRDVSMRHIGEIKIYEPGANIGVAGAWNYLLHTNFEQENEHEHEIAQQDYVLLCNNDIQWAPGDLEKMHAAAISDPGMCAVFGNWSFSNFLVTRRGVETLGYFDENFYPAYLEDGDYWRRIVLSQAKICHAVGIRSTHGENGEGSCTINSDPDLARQNGVTHARNWKYYHAKWGFRGEVERETYTHPFNACDAYLEEWELSEERMTEPHYFSSSLETIKVREGETPSPAAETAALPNQIGEPDVTPRQSEAATT